MAYSPIISSTFVIPEPTLVESGIVFHIKSDAGVQTSGTNVTAWYDQASGLDLSATGAPQYFAVGTPAGKPSIDFDGSDDYLSRAISGSQVLPDGAEDRTVFFVVKYNSVGYGGFAYGNADIDEAFGTIVDNAGALTVQAWGGNDAVTVEAGNGAGWLIQSAIVNANALSHYKDGALIDSDTITYATNNQSIVLGAEIDLNPKIHMNVAAVIVYDRALSAAEHDQVVAFLDRKYVTTDPLAYADTATVNEGETVVIDVLANDHAYYSIDPTTVEITDQPTYGTVNVNGTTGEITYEHTSAFADLTDTFSYRYQDLSNGTWSNEAVVSVDIYAPAQTIWCNESDNFLLDYVLERKFIDRDADFELGLYTNATVNVATTLADITEPTGGGYARKTISDSSWIAGNPRTYPPQDFIPTGGDYSAPVYGYFIATKSSGGTQKLFILAKRGEPITLTDGEIYRISLAIGT